MNTLEKIVNQLHLIPHPEGGYYKETYRSTGEIQSESLDDNYHGNRNYSTCIYFLLTSDNFSALHRIKQDEIWHFYDGAPIRLHTLSPSGEHTEHIIGRDFEQGQVPQLVVSGGDWFAAEVMGEDAFSLVGCTVSPGFSFVDFELAARDELLEKFPAHEDLIRSFTRIN